MLNPSDAPNTIPSTRTEVVLPRVGEASDVVVRVAPLSAPSPGRVLLSMEATGVSFAEQQMRLGRYYDQPSFPFVPGYDVVGTVIGIGEGVDAHLLGGRFAAVTKVGAWAEVVEVNAQALLEVPDVMDASEVETVIVNGITAHRMLHDLASVPAGGTVVVLGANGGVGSTLVQLARAAGHRVIGTASQRHHALLRDLGAEPVDYAGDGLYARLRGLAPEGVDAVFDHVGGRGLVQSWRLLRRGGTLVSYGTAAGKDGTGNVKLAFLPLFARLGIWNALPNGRRAVFFDFWADRKRPERFYAAQREAFAAVVEQLRSGVIRAQIAKRVPLSQAATAFALAESRTLAGKVIIIPD